MGIPRWAALVLVPQWVANGSTDFAMRASNPPSFPAPRAPPAACAAHSPVYGGLPRPCRVDSLPSIRAIYEALVANGYSSSPPGGGPRRGLTPRKQLAAQQRQALPGQAATGAAGRSGAGGGGGGGEGEEEGPELRIQAVKLVLQTAAAVCQYCEQVRSVAEGSDTGEDCMMQLPHGEPGCRPCWVVWSVRAVTAPAAAG